MSKIESVLKDTEQDFWISDYERKELCDLLTFIGTALQEKLFWINGPGSPENEHYAALAIDMAKRFANMPVNKEQ